MIKIFFFFLPCPLTISVVSQLSYHNITRPHLTAWYLSIIAGDWHWPARLHSIAMCFYLSMTIIQSNPVRKGLPAVHYALKMAGTIGRCRVSAISQEHGVYRSLQQHSSPDKGGLWQHVSEGSSSQLSPGQSIEERTRKNLSAHEQRVFNTGVESAKHRPLKSWNKPKQMASEEDDCVCELEFIYLG